MNLKFEFEFKNIVLRLINFKKKLLIDICYFEAYIIIYFLIRYL